MYVTFHAAQRLRERMGVPKKSVERVALNAYVKGATRNECTGAMLRWLEMQEVRFGRRMNWRVYAECVFAFSTDGDDALITIIPVGKTMKKGIPHEGGGHHERNRLRRGPKRNYSLVFDAAE